MKIFLKKGLLTSLSHYEGELMIDRKQLKTRPAGRSAASKAQLDRHMRLQDKLTTFEELDEWQAEFVSLLLGAFRLPPERQAEFDRVIARMRALSVERIVYNQFLRLPKDLQDWVVAEEAEGVPFDVAFAQAVRSAKERNYK